MRDKKKMPMKEPPEESIKSVQYDLFTQFLSNNKNDVSNMVEVWESIPKYFFTPRQISQLRTEGGLAEPYKWNFSYNDSPCTVKIQPALIEQENGKYKAFFPSVTEELVEEALKKIFTDQQFGIHNPQKTESWVRFTLGMIQKELKNRGRSRDKKQIKHAIEVMSSCVITLYKEEKEIWKGSILQDLVSVNRHDYLADTNSQHIARLPLFISHSVNTLEYRQFNYERLMSCNEQLTRWIYKQLINRFKQANLMNTYHFMYSKVYRDSGLLQQKTEDKNRQKVRSSLTELIDRGVIANFTEDIRKEGRKIVDVKYTVSPTTNFVSEQKAANKRCKDGKTKALSVGIQIDS